MSNQNNLKRMKGADRIRKQVNVMLGSDDIKGVQQGLFEITSNSIDRHRRGFGNYIEVIKNKDLSYEVKDYADGLPMNWNDEENAYNWELATRVLYAGGNYEKDSESIGQHGLGLSSTLLSSSKCEVISNRKGYTYSIKMIDGRPVHKETGQFICDDVDELFSKEDGEKILISYENKNNNKGTRVIWTPDKTIFTDTNISIDWINDKLKKQAIINKGLTIKVIDNFENKEYTHVYDSGISDYIKEISQDKEIVDFIHFEDNGTGRDAEDKPEYNYRYEFVMTLNNEISLSEQYHNSSELLEGGSTCDAIKKALVDATHDYCDKNGMYKKGERKIKYSDTCDSLICVISSFSNRTSFANQTKLAINNDFIKKFTTDSLYNKLTVYFMENEKTAKRICEQILINKQANDVNVKSRQALKKKLTEKVDALSKIEGLYDCKNKTGLRRFAICEGKSALSSLLFARPDNLAIMGIRGKLTNAKKSTRDKVLSDTIIINILRALGVKIDESKSKNNKLKFDVSSMSYDEIDICTDADVDGIGSIAPLILTMLNELIPDVITNGLVNIIMTPLYEIQDLDNDIMYYAVNDKELKEKVEKLNNTKYKVCYVKGLAELTTEGMSMALVDNYENRIQVRADNYNEVLKALELHMGKQVKPRYDYIVENFDKVDYID